MHPRMVPFRVLDMQGLMDDGQTGLEGTLSIAATAHGRCIEECHPDVRSRRSVYSSQVVRRNPVGHDQMTDVRKGFSEKKLRSILKALQKRLRIEINYRKVEKVGF